MPVATRWLPLNPWLTRILTSTEIEVIESATFQRAKNLRSLYLTSNSLVTIKKDTFRNNFKMKLL